MNYFKHILVFAKPYKSYAVLNIICNIFYALFSALAFVAFIPMLDVLFNEEKAKVTEKPVYNGFLELGSYLENTLSFHINSLAQTNVQNALLLAISLIISLFLLKNIFNYLAMYFITFLHPKCHSKYRYTLPLKKYIRIVKNFPNYTKNRL